MQMRYRYRIEPTPAQQQKLARVFGCARVVFNDALRVRDAAYRAGVKLSDSETVRVKADETVAHFDLMNASGVGLLIQAVVGSFGGAGFWCRNRAGLAV